MKFYHHQNPDNFGGITLAYDIIEHHQGKALVVSFAQCSKKDQYRKASGRSLAAKRMMEGDMFSLTIKGSKKSIKDRLSSTLKDLANTLNKLQYN